MELAHYLQPLIDGNVHPVKNNVDARLNNVMGYLKYGKHIWGNAGIPQRSASRRISEDEAQELETIEEAEEIIPLPDDDTLEDIEELVEEHLSGTQQRAFQHTG